MDLTGRRRGFEGLAPKHTPANGKQVDTSALLIAFEGESTTLDEKPENSGGICPLGQLEV